MPGHEEATAGRNACQPLFHRHETGSWRTTVCLIYSLLSVLLPSDLRGVKPMGGSSMKRIRVLLAEDHAVVRQGLRALLSLEKDMEVVGEVQDGREAVGTVKKLLPDVVIMDIAMPLLNGVEATRQIVRLVPDTRVLILSAHSEDEYVAQVVEAGAAGYLHKQTGAKSVVMAIREIHRGATFFSPSISRRIGEMQSMGRGSRTRKDAARLTSREREVLQLIAEGMGNKQTAAELGISIKTVEKHRQHLMRKLGIHDTAGLTRYAIFTGIIETRGPITIE
jgi:two-component system, NarL family, nitrate/nitrite response regulator NarL